ncbi:hypothetical protein QJQ45_010126 [Haematococcus lacustris]|nr:hypothetical protein QJQ45_010126 [Haematococcus lacustris]
MWPLLSKGQLKHDSGLTQAKQDTTRWSAAIQPQLQQLAAATSAGTTLDGLQPYIQAFEATWNQLWEEYYKPRWRRQRWGLYNAQEHVIGRFCKKLEGPGGSTPIGKEYQQGYKLVNDRLPKGRQRLHRAAEDGRARNNP